MRRSQVEFRPWAGIAIPPSLDYAMSLTRTRRIFWLVTDPVWYLGERVVRQHSSEEFVVPMDPPPTMMNDDLKKYWEGPHSSAGVGLDWREVTFPDQSYRVFRTRLASPVEFRLVEWNFAGGDVPHVEMSVEYTGPTGVVMEQLAEPPEAALLSTHSLSPDFQGFTREGSQQVLRVLDGYRWHLQALMAERARARHYVVQVHQCYQGFVSPRPPYSGAVFAGGPSA